MSFSRFAIPLALALFAIDSSGFPSAESIRVRVFTDSRIERVEFQSAGRDSLIVSEAGQLLVALPPGEAATLEIWQGMLRVRWSRGSAPVNRCRIESPSNVRVTPDGRSGRSYRGRLDVTPSSQSPGTIQIVNDVDIEHYVASVLPSEYPFREIEGVKAQAIVIRTYALTSQARGDDYRLRDDAQSQVYRGVGTETDLSRSAAHMTAGATASYDGALIEAVYSSHCGGHSADNEDIWGSTPVPYLRGRKDPYDHDAPVAEWSNRVDASDLHDRLSRSMDRRVRGFKVSDRGAGKHVRSVRIDFDDGPDEEMRGERFRALANRAWGSEIVRSSSFEIKKRSGEYEFKGRGYGHGVGFCQWGASEQAKEGKSYQEILAFYYRDVDVSAAVPAEVFASVQVNEPQPTLEPTVPSEQPDDSPSKRRTRRPGW